MTCFRGMGYFLILLIVSKGLPESPVSRGAGAAPVGGVAEAPVLTLAGLATPLAPPPARTPSRLKNIQRGHHFNNG